MKILLSLLMIFSSSLAGAGQVDSTLATFSKRVGWEWYTQMTPGQKAYEENGETAEDLRVTQAAISAFGKRHRGVYGMVGRPGTYTGFLFMTGDNLVCAMGSGRCGLPHEYPAGASIDVGFSCYATNGHQRDYDYDFNRSTNMLGKWKACESDDRGTPTSPAVMDQISRASQSTWCQLHPRARSCR